MANHNEIGLLPIGDSAYERQQPAGSNPREDQSVIDLTWPGATWPQTWNPDYTKIPTYGPNNWWHQQQADLNKLVPIHEFAQFEKFANGILCKMADISKKNPGCAATWSGEWKAI